MSERVITIHKTPHVSWQGTEAAAAATELIGDAHEANVNGTENGLALKKNADAPKSMCTLGATLTQTSEVSKILREGTKTPHGAQRQIDLQNVPNPQASFEDTSHAYECGYLDGLAKGRETSGADAQNTGAAPNVGHAAPEVSGDLVSREATKAREVFGETCGTAMEAIDYLEQLLIAQPQGETPDQRGVLRARELLSDWLETPNEGDAMVDCLLGVIREAHTALGGSA